jgi:hypothetical protein
VIHDTQPSIVRQATFVETNDPAASAKSLEGCRQPRGWSDARLCDEELSARKTRRISPWSIATREAHDVVDIDWLGDQRRDVCHGHDEGNTVTREDA